ncbi:MAG: hypothetical protein HYR56_10415 [Acidobacteria bacterium]|nr:hypothetical protein [Acidobacteriota bacterium]MBI3425626.1 hypothetical protein [Acidobacteriota bacterium]
MSDLTHTINAVLKAIWLLLPVGVVCTVLVVAVAWFYNRFAKSEVWRTSVFIGVFAAFGATIGIFIGASSSPTIASILPTVITLISSYLAFTVTKDMPQEFQVVVPGALLAFLASLLFSTFYMKFWLL